MSEDEIARGIAARIAQRAIRQGNVVRMETPRPTPPKLEDLIARAPAAPTVAANQADQFLTVMNNRHAIIDNVGGKTVIASW